MNETATKLTRIGVFYDGGYFSHVSNYYAYNHIRKARLSVSGLHEFIRRQVADAEGVDMKYCQIVDAHYFRGRYSAQEAQSKDRLLLDRIFDDILMNEGVVTHFLPLQTRGGITTEKGIDVWFALEAFELAMYKRFNVLVLIASDSDYIPLIRKLNTLGTRVMLLGWDFEYVDQNQQTRKTTTSLSLMDEVTYPILMHNVIDDKTKRNDPVVNSIFVTPQQNKAFIPPAPKTFSTSTTSVNETGKRKSKITQLKGGYGFILNDMDKTDLFFFHADVENCDFNELTVGDQVEYKIGKNDKGPAAIEIYKLQTTT